MINYRLWMALKTTINDNGKLMVIYEKQENGCCYD